MKLILFYVYVRMAILLDPSDVRTVYQSAHSYVPLSVEPIQG